MIETCLYLFTSWDIFCRQGVLFDKRLIHTIKQYLPPKISCTRSYFYYPITCFDKLFVVLYNNYGITHLLQLSYRDNYFFYLCFIETYSWFI